MIRRLGGYAYAPRQPVLYQATARVLVVVDQDFAELLQDVRRRLDLVGATVLGFVVNRTDMAHSPYSYEDDYSLEVAPSDDDPVADDGHGFGSGRKAATTRPAGD